MIGGGHYMSIFYGITLAHVSSHPAIAEISVLREGTKKKKKKKKKKKAKQRKNTVPITMYICHITDQQRCATLHQSKAQGWP